MKKNKFLVPLNRNWKKLLLTMKLCLLFLLISATSLMANSGYSQATKLSIHLKNATLRDLIREVEKQSEFIFVFYDEVVDLDREVNVQADDQTINKILDEIFESSDLIYQIFDRQIGIGKRDPVTGLIELPGPLEVQVVIDKKLTGVVKDIKGQPLPGATVIVKGMTIGVATDPSGNFTLQVPLDAKILSVSFVGYKPVEIPIGNKTTFNILLEEMTVGVEEVVAVGYGQQRKESVVGAISQAKGDDIRQNVQGADLGAAFKGSVPGMISLQSTGVPGGTDYGTQNRYQETELYIRGKKTWNDASPLILVDGIERDMNNVNPNDIEQVSVLKDASATAVFGVKGANGVILITTRTGQEGKARISFDYTATVKTLSRIKLDMANAYDANMAKNYSILNEIALDEGSWDHITPQAWVEYYKTQEYPEYFPDINWRDEVIKDYTLDHKYNLTLSGGTKFVKYFSTLSFLEETDLLNQGDVGQGYDPSFNFKRINLRSNLDFNLTPSTSLKVNLSGHHYIQSKSGGGIYAFRGIWFMASDLWPSKYRDGTYAEDMTLTNVSNVLWEFNHSGLLRYKGTGITTDFVLKQELDFFIKGLSAEVKLAYDNSLSTSGPHVSGILPMSKYILPSIVDDPRMSPNLKDPQLRELEEEYTNWNVTEVQLLGGGDWSHGYDWTLGPSSYGGEAITLGSSYRSLLYEFRLNYKRNFGKHEVSALALMSRQEQSRGSVFPSYREDWVGRGTYEFDRRYLLEVNAAYNGSEKFGMKYRFGLFPSIAAGWIVSNESFFENFKPFFSNLKFRYSNGIVGSDAGIARWLYASSYVVKPDGSGGQNVYWFGAPDLQEGYPFRFEGNIANPDIKWEESHKTDYGIEAGFFDDKLKFNIDYFEENRTNVFLTASQRVIPEYFGAPAVSANVGEVNVHGWEIEAQYSKMTSGGIHYWLKYSLAYARDEIIERGDPELRPKYQKLAGYSIDQPRATLSQGDHSVMNSWNDVYMSTGPQSLGQYVQPGDFHRIDFNSDGIIDADDAVPVGYPFRPQYSYASSAGISYKNLSANMRFYGVYNVASSIPAQYVVDFGPEFQDRVHNILLVDSWSPERDVTTDAKIRAMRYRTGGFQGYVPFPNSFLKLESAQIAYDLTKKEIPMLGSIGISKLTLTLSGNNLFMISKMLVDRDLRPSIDDRSAYPSLRRYNFGININF